MKKKKKVVVVMPAYNAARTLEQTFNKIPEEFASNVIVVDDGSKDQTVKIAQKLKLKLITHQKNLGYGANQKTCYKNALKLGADIIVMLHPDYQYDPKYIKYLVTPIVDGSFDIMLGSRIRTRKETLANGMPRYKYFANRFLTLLENLSLGLNLSDYHTGYRAYHRKILERINLDKLSNDFIFDQQILFSAHLINAKIGEIYTPCFYRANSSSINFKRSIKYGISILLNLFYYLF
ncbi:glycosyltransferase family 2 protein [Candidatus Daviesbacteria bacterium]|nr:glycosyltransferase family 2 protein [Candidatus Daviesbacteria bacterium]